MSILKIQEHNSLFALPAGGSRRHLILQWATYHYMIVNMHCADALKSEGLNGGEGEAWGHEDQLNSDCTTGEGTKNNPDPTPPCFSPRLRECKIPDRHCTVCALTGAKYVQLIFVLFACLWCCSFCLPSGKIYLAAFNTCWCTSGMWNEDALSRWGITNGMFIPNLLNINYVMSPYIPSVSHICVRLLCVGDKVLRAEHFVSTHSRKSPMLSEAITPACSFHWRHLGLW